MEDDITKLTGTPYFTTYSHITTHTPATTPKVNEILSIYKQCIWQVRGALYYEGGINDIPRELYHLYVSKTNRLPKTGIG